MSSIDRPVVPSVLPYVVVDTEGRDVLKEIAVLDHRGTLLYQAWVAEHPDNDRRTTHTQPLQTVVKTFLSIVHQHAIICHNAQHDRQVIERACQQLNLRIPHLRFICTLELAQATFPHFASYSLEYLSKKLLLRVNQKSFNPRQAHTAKYDAEFTYQLYQKILDKPPSQRPFPMNSILQSKPNPFASSRVDTPFQDHPDQTQIYQLEFEQLKIAIGEIQQDHNRQSRGAVVIGEPGSGKTHLMMRLAKELLKVNRLLFIRHPNNPDAILYHIYSRILESVIQTVPDTGYTQLEHLISHSFTKLIRTSRHLKLTTTDQVILTAVQDSPLNLYALAAEGTEKKRSLWAHIDKRLQEWWVEHYGFSGSATQILKGIVKFCSYSDPNRKSIVQRWLAAIPVSSEDLAKVGLDDWRENLGTEEFSLEAIAVLSKLSLLDEPLLIVFDQLESLGLPHNAKLLVNFGEAVKEIFTHVPNSLIIINLFPDRWQHFQQILSRAVVDRVSQVQLELKRPDQETLRRILQLRMRSIDVEILDLFTPDDLKIILAQASIRGMLNCAANYFRYRVHSIPLPQMPQPSTIEKRVDLIEEQLKEQTSQTLQTPQPSTIEKRVDLIEEQLQELQNRVSKLEDPKVLPTSPTSIPTSTPIPTPTPISPSSPTEEYLRSQRRSIQQAYQTPQIFTDSDDIGKLTTIAEAFRSIYPVEIDYLRLGRRVLPEHLVLMGNQKIAIGFLHIDGNSFTNRIKNWNEALMNDRSIHYQLWRDARSPNILGKVGCSEIEKLNNTPQGQFLILGEEERIDFELIYGLIIDIQNRDLDVTLKDALEHLMSNLSESWLIQFINALI